MAKTWLSSLSCISPVAFFFFMSASSSFLNILNVPLLSGDSSFLILFHNVHAQFSQYQGSNDALRRDVYFSLVSFLQLIFFSVLHPAFKCLRNILLLLGAVSKDFHCLDVPSFQNSCVFLFLLSNYITLLAFFLNGTNLLLGSFIAQVFFSQLLNSCGALSSTQMFLFGSFHMPCTSK